MTTSDLPTPPISTNEEDNLKLASQVASVNLLFAQHELAKRVIDPTITTKGLLDIAEHSYKVSGMAKKQEAKEDGGKFVFSIVIGDTPMRIEKTIGGDVESVVDIAADAQALLSVDLDFSDAPEF